MQTCISRLIYPYVLQCAWYYTLWSFRYLCFLIFCISRRAKNVTCPCPTCAHSWKMLIPIRVRHFFLMLLTFLRHLLACDYQKVETWHCQYHKQAGQVLFLSLIISKLPFKICSHAKDTLMLCSRRGFRRMKFMS